MSPMSPRVPLPRAARRWRCAPRDAAGGRGRLQPGHAGVPTPPPPALRGAEGAGGVLAGPRGQPCHPPRAPTHRDPWVSRAATAATPTAPLHPNCPPRPPPSMRSRGLGLQRAPSWPQPEAPVPPSPKLVQDRTDLLPACAPRPRRAPRPAAPRPAFPAGGTLSQKEPALLTARLPARDRGCPRGSRGTWEAWPGRPRQSCRARPGRLRPPRMNPADPGGRPRLHPQLGGQALASPRLLPPVPFASAVSVADFSCSCLDFYPCSYS